MQEKYQSSHHCISKTILAKMKNCVSHEGFKTISIESMIKLQPTKMLLTEHSIAGYQSVKRFKQDPQLRLLPAVKQGNIYLFDALEIFSIGPRSLQAISQWPQRKLDDQYQIDPNKKVS